MATLEKTVNYKYDGLGRRIEKEVTETGVTTTTRYIYDREDILLEIDGNTNIVTRFTHGPGIDEPLIMEKSDKSFFYHADGLGSITELTDTAATVVQSYSYSSFGKIESQLDPAFVQPFMFTSREFDPETGLYFYRTRTYDSSVGRFLQEDPIGLKGGDLNLYPYVRNNPVTFIDPSGEGPIAVGICVGLVVTDTISTITILDQLDKKLKELDAQMKALEKSCRPGEIDIEKFEKIKELESRKFKLGEGKVRAQGRLGSVLFVGITVCPALVAIPGIP